MAWLKSHEPTARGPSCHTARVRASPSSRACKELLHPTPLWLGFIVVWTNCGLDPLWFGSIVVWLKSHEPTARGPRRRRARVRASPSSRAYKKLLHPSHLWLGFIVVWTNCGLDQLWFRSIVVWIVSHFWLASHCFIGICSTRYMFKMRLGESNFSQ